MTKPMHRLAKKVTIDPRYGKSPADRDIDEQLKNGVIVIDKPMGPTSHQVATWVKEMLGIDKTAHGGTLDPRVTGVLPIGMGAAVRAMDYIHNEGKRYVGVMRLHGDVEDGELRSVIRNFTGEIFQKPPVRSSVKREIRTREIYSLKIIESRDRDVLFDVRCEGGTYIRTLCVDIGEVLTVGAHLQDLRRIEAGIFSESDALTLHALRDAVEYWKEGDARTLGKMIRPFEDIFSSWKRIIVKDSAVGALCHGANLAVPGIVELSRNIEKEDKVAFFTLKGELIATGISIKNFEEIKSMKDGFVVKLDRVFLKSDIYPRIWSSSKEKK